MSYYWCHGPNCHTKVTTDRVRGSKGSKVLRTRKITINSNGWPSGMWQYFCTTNCYNEFANKYVEQIIRIAPRHEPLETPCEVNTETRTGWDGREYSYKTVDKLSNVG